MDIVITATGRLDRTIEASTFRKSVEMKKDESNDSQR